LLEDTRKLVTAVATMTGFYISLIYLISYHSQHLPGDSIAAAFDSVTVELNFPDYLWINYKPGTVPREYKAQFPDEGTQMISQVTLINGRPIQLQSTGNYYSPTDFLNMGYWGWSEKIASMLPFDYKPKHNKKAP
jgi:hypothetical protein